MRSASLFAGLLASATVAVADTQRLLYQGNGSITWLENLRVRSNGLVLTTVIGPPANLLQFDPSQDDPEPYLLATFPSVLGISGITEVAHDVFYIAGANTTGENISDPPVNASKIWKVDFNRGGDYDPEFTLISEPVLPLVTDFNGMTTFNDSVVLASASFESTVVAMDVHTGAYWTAFTDADMNDINGIKVGGDGYLYWTASAGAFRAPLYENLTIGAAQTLYAGSYDDLAVSPDGFALAANGTRVLYLACNQDEIQQLIIDDATGAVVNASYVAASTADITWGKGTGCDFGRAEGQKNKVYCVSGGDLEAATTSGIGGQLFEITVYEESAKNQTVSHSSKVAAAKKQGRHSRYAARGYVPAL